MIIDINEEVRQDVLDHLEDMRLISTFEEQLAYSQIIDAIKVLSFVKPEDM